VSGPTISMWKKQFIEGGRAGLAGELRSQPCDELELRREIEQLKIALGEAHLKLRWQRHADAATCGTPPAA
jgi:transposase